MTTFLSRVLAGALAGTALMSLLNGAQAQSAAERSKARDHFSIGIELLDETPPKYHDALLQFRSAYELSRSWKVLGNMGLCAHKLERDGEAVAYYRQYLKDGGADVSPAERKDIARDLLAIKAGLAHVELSSDVADASLTVTRRESALGGQAYTLKDKQASLGLRAGAYRIDARAGTQKRTWTVVLQSKDTVQHQFNFSGRAGAADGQAPPPTSGARLLQNSRTERDTQPAPIPQTDTGVSSGALLWTGVAGVAVGGIGIGLSLLQAESLEADGTALFENPTCDQTVGSDCQRQVDEKFDEAEQWQLWGSVGFGAVAAVGAGMIIWSLASDGDTESAMLLPVLAPQVTGVVFHSTF